jgi:hypothetical protein
MIELLRVLRLSCEAETASANDVMAGMMEFADRAVDEARRLTRGVRIASKLGCGPEIVLVMAERALHGAEGVGEEFTAFLRSAVGGFEDGDDVLQDDA